jgi:hypothetical protein
MREVGGMKPKVTVNAKKQGTRRLRKEGSRRVSDRVCR